MSADGFKDQGNTYFRSGDLAKAAEMYSRGIELDPSHAVLLNNRAACYLGLERWAEAARDAQNSVIAAPTSKAYHRLGRANYMQARYEQAEKAYQSAVSLEPTNEAFQSSLQDVRRVLAELRAGRGGARAGMGDSTAGSPSGGGFDGNRPSAWRSIALSLNIAVVVSSVLHFVCLFVSPELAYTLWSGVLLCMAVRNLLGVVRGSITPSLSLEYLKHLGQSIVSNFSGQYFMLAVALLLSGAPPVHLILASFVMYCVMDIATNFSSDLRQMLSPAGGGGGVGGKIWSFVAPYLDKLAREADQFFTQVALLEVYQGLLAFISGLSMIQSMMYWQFLRARYRTDHRYARRAFNVVFLQLRGWLSHRLVPPAVLAGFDKLAAAMNRMAQ